MEASRLKHPTDPSAQRNNLEKVPTFLYIKTLVTKKSFDRGEMRTSPINSPSIPKTSARGSPSRSPSYQTNLSLRTVIGTSTISSNGFATYEAGRQFAFCAGSTTVLAELDDKLNVSQRFFRARTSVPGSSSSNPSTSHVPLAGAHNRPRAHSGSSRTTPIRNGSFGASDPVGGSPASTARERVKSVTSVALSPNGRFIAAGEVSLSKSY